MDTDFMNTALLENKLNPKWLVEITGPERRHRFGLSS